MTSRSASYRLSSVVLLYTDGLVERRRQDLDDGLAWLRTTVADLADTDRLDPERLCDALLDAVSDAGENDLILLALRVRDPHAEADAQG